MGKYKFVKEKDPNNKYDNATIEFDMEVETWTDLLEYFNEFILACGFHPNGKFDCIEEEENETK